MGQKKQSGNWRRECRETASLVALPAKNPPAKNPPAKQEMQETISGSGRSPREGNGNPLQYSCLENPMDRGAWQATVHGVRKESNVT